MSGCYGGSFGTCGDCNLLNRLADMMKFARGVKNGVGAAMAGAAGTSRRMLRLRAAAGDFEPDVAM